MPVVSGVPQGSILGPLLFLAYIDRLGQAYSENASVILYADDLVYVKPLIQEKDWSDMALDVALIQSAFQSLSLKLNARKCKLMRMSISRQPFDLSVKVAGEDLEVVEEYKYLGVVIDPEMTFREHCRRTVSRARQAIGALSRSMRKWVPRSVFARVYRGSIEPVLLYGMDACYPSQVGLQNQLERTHRFAARLASNDFSSEYVGVLRKLGWSSMQQMAVERSLTLCWSLVRKRRVLPEGVLELRSEAEGEGERRSRRIGHPLEVVLTKSKKSHVTAMPFNNIKRLWNALTPEEVETASKAEFKTALRSWSTFERLKGRGLVNALRG